MTDKTWQPHTLHLRWPIEDDKGQRFDSLTLNLINHTDHAAVLASDPEERQAFAEFARLSCGLTEQEVKRLKRPDWNSLCLKFSDMVSQPSSHFWQELGVSVDPDNPPLLKPIQGDDGRTIKQVNLHVPSVETTDLMQKHEDPNQRSLFISMACTGLSEQELGRLSVPDWNQLQGRINDFLNETADYFRPGTSTS